LDVCLKGFLKCLVSAFCISIRLMLRRSVQGFVILLNIFKTLLNKNALHVARHFEFILLNF
jgi:hypothetical protein